MRRPSLLPLLAAQARITIEHSDLSPSGVTSNMLTDAGQLSVLTDGADPHRDMGGASIVEVGTDGATVARGTFVKE